jgi:hypothetical protein
MEKLKYKNLLFLIIENKNKENIIKKIEDFLDLNEMILDDYNRNVVNDRNYKNKKLRLEAKEMFNEIVDELSSLHKQNKESLFNLYDLIYAELKNSPNLLKRIFDWEDIYTNHESKYGYYRPHLDKQIRTFRNFVEILKDINNNEIISDPNYKDTFIQDLENLKYIS